MSVRRCENARLHQADTGTSIHSNPLDETQPS